MNLCRFIKNISVVLSLDFWALSVIQYLKRNTVFQTSGKKVDQWSRLTLVAIAIGCHFKPEESSEQCPTLYTFLMAFEEAVTTSLDSTSFRLTCCLPCASCST